jgi:hypothetical protein
MFFAALALVASGAAAGSAAQLREAASAHAGQPIRLDERLQVPPCPSGFAFREPAGGAPGLEASCPENGWRMRLPLSAAPAADFPRRGQLLRVEVQGAGYRATVDGIVEAANARDGSLLLKNPRSGSRFTAHVQPDGQIVARRP